MRAKQKEIESAVEGGQGFRQAFLHREGELKKLQDHIDYLSQMLRKSDDEIERYRGHLEKARHESNTLEARFGQE